MPNAQSYFFVRIKTRFAQITMKSITALSCITKVNRNMDGDAFRNKPRSNEDFYVTCDQFATGVSTIDVEKCEFAEMQKETSATYVLCHAHTATVANTEATTDVMRFDANSIMNPIDEICLPVTGFYHAVTNEEVRDHWMVPVLHVPVGCTIQFSDTDWDEVIVSVQWNGHTVSVVPINRDTMHMLDLNSITQKCQLSGCDAPTTNTALVQWMDLGDARITRMFESLSICVTPASSVSRVKWILRPVDNSIRMPPVSPRWAHFHSIEKLDQCVDIDWPMAPPGASAGLDVRSAIFRLSDLSFQHTVSNYIVTGLSAVLRWNDGTMPSSQEMSHIVSALHMTWTPAVSNTPFTIVCDKNGDNPILYAQLASYSNFRWALNMHSTYDCIIQVDFDVNADVRKNETQPKLTVAMYVHRICAVRCVRTGVSS